MTYSEIAHRMSYLTLDLEKMSYKQAWQGWWNSATKGEKAKILDLPNFDADIFEEITGIDLRKTNGK